MRFGAVAGRSVFAMLAALTSSQALAKPSADAVRQTWDYFYNGQGGGPILVDARLCGEVAKAGPQRFDCVEVLDPTKGLSAGESVMLHQEYLVPQGDKVKDLVVVLQRGGETRLTRPVNPSGSGWRSRQWVSLPLTEPGRWSVAVKHGDDTLRRIQFEVR